ncbi:Oidioi.mRNA.OKI2018_I69.chr1.g560.t1.cds [Oikopleura dioica]|uniref:Oidioi.mRNA.OKI2018_I69.chr1.g560.t1.cds n=1 Tax=Oikopleura dioica TaxID=34765 RepID=A0ABN7SLX7_OIKDI|nr:Oidioi.mRNA.OKI2018_I69.chr1.g560.t1.cds [Oikopleura dioica]
MNEITCHHENQTAVKVLLCQEEQNRLLIDFHQIAQKEEIFQKQHPLNCICDDPASTGCKVANFLRLDFTDCTKNEARTVAKCTPIVESATEEIKGFEKVDPPKETKIQEFFKTNYSFRECCFDWETCIGGSDETKRILDTYSTQKNCIDAYEITSQNEFYNITRSFLYKCAHVIPMKSTKAKHIMQSCQMMSLHCHLAFAMTEKHFCSCNKMTENQTDFERCSVYQVFLDHNPCLAYFDPSANLSKATVLEHNEEVLHEKSYSMEWIQVIIGNRIQINF